MHQKVDSLIILPREYSCQCPVPEEEGEHRGDDEEANSTEEVREEGVEGQGEGEEDQA
jgi:hypothetical protein